jgi:hypothetical protein
MDWNMSELVVFAKGTAYSANLNQLDANPLLEMSVVNEFPDVFPEVLLVMPPNWDIEFVIELVHDTSPICKRPYRRAAKQLADLKD